MTLGNGNGCDRGSRIGCFQNELSRLGTLNFDQAVNEQPPDRSVWPCLECTGLHVMAIAGGADQPPPLLHARDAFSQRHAKGNRFVFSGIGTTRQTWFHYHADLHRSMVPDSETDLMRELAKNAARAVSYVCILPALASFAIRTLVIGKDRALEGSTQFLSLVPGLPGQYLRRAFLSQSTAHCAPSATIAFGTIFSKSGARIDDNAY